MTGDLNEGRYKYTKNPEFRYVFEDKTRAGIIADREGGIVMSEPLKEFLKQTCPECGKINHINEGASIAADEGTFFYCVYCGKPSISLHKGARFIQSSEDLITYPGKTVYEIAGDIGDLIPCIEIRKINASPLSKINRNYYQYFTKKEIIFYMNKEYREDL